MPSKVCPSTIFTPKTNHSRAGGGAQTGGGGHGGAQLQPPPVPKKNDDVETNSADNVNNRNILKWHGFSTQRAQSYSGQQNGLFELAVWAKIGTIKRNSPKRQKFRNRVDNRDATARGRTRLTARDCTHALRHQPLHLLSAVAAATTNFCESAIM